MDSEKDKLERLMKIIREDICYAEHKHSIDSEIAKDIGCEGLDAELLLERIAEEFDVDFSEFRFYDYFVDESMCSAGPFLWWMFPWMWELYGLNFKEKKSITIRRLYEAVLQGKWIEPG